jgi:hypothetical protein
MSLLFTGPGAPPGCTGPVLSDSDIQNVVTEAISRAAAANLQVAIGW